MTCKDAIEFWKFKYDMAKDYKDEHWEAEERRAHYDYVNAMQMAVEALERESKTGRWIKYGVPRCGEQHYQCTSCGYYINFGQWGELYTKEFKYCPCCGIKMEVEDDTKKETSKV
jgi:hypothetical protein